MTRRNNTLERQPALLKTARILDALRKRPQTAPELAELLCTTLKTVKLYLRILRDRRQVHIGSWTRASVAGLAERPREVWAAGEGRDARRLKRLTPQQVCQRQWAKLKQDPDAYADYLAKARHRMEKKRFVPRPDIAAAWIAPKR